MNRQLTDKEIKAAYKYVGKHSASPVIAGMQITTLRHDLPPAASCQVKAVALLKAGEGVWREAWLPAFRKAIWQWAPKSLKIFILFTP